MVYGMSKAEKPWHSEPVRVGQRLWVRNQWSVVCIGVEMVCTWNSVGDMNGSLRL
jgi:hypothetical protein